MAAGVSVTPMRARRGSPGRGRNWHPASEECSAAAPGQGSPSPRCAGRGAPPPGHQRQVQEERHDRHGGTKGRRTGGSSSISTGGSFRVDPHGLQPLRRAQKLDPVDTEPPRPALFRQPRTSPGRRSMREGGRCSTHPVIGGTRLRKPALGGLTPLAAGHHQRHLRGRHGMGRVVRAGSPPRR